RLDDRRGRCEDHAYARSSGGLSLRKAANNRRSYAILSPPQISSGQICRPAVNSMPAMAGLAAAARLRGTAVALAAAGRSASLTTAIAYEERAGTSICPSMARTIRSATVSPSVGANAARIRHTLAGMCVNTIVFTSPIREPSQAATGNENAANTPIQKKIALAA